MAKALLLLIVVAAVSALQYMGIVVIIDNLDTVPLWAIILSTGIVANAITAVVFTALTGIEQKLEIAKLRIRVMKAELSPLKDLVEFMKEREKNTSQVNIKVDAEDLRSAVEEATTENKEEPAAGIIFEEINPRTKKPYKRSFAERQALREKALKREQEKRMKKTAEESKKRKARK